jgi:5-methylcytosine-specific restriction endonuclease McrA
VKVLLLNNSEEVISVITWQDAVIKYVTGKAKKPYGHDEFYDIRTSSMIFKLPTVLMLVTYVRIPHKSISITKENVLRRDGFECQYCGRKLTTNTGTIDHVQPTSRGGKHSWANVVASCVKCNNTKDNRMPEEAGMKTRCRPYVPTSDLLLITAVDLHTKKSWSRWVMM